jgi:hypothetical protein
VSLDVTALTPQRWESVAATLEEGLSLYAGCLPTDGRATDGTGTARAAANAVADGLHRAGMPDATLRDVVASPACGLAGLTPEGAWRVQRVAVDVAAEWSERAES